MKKRNFILNSFPPPEYLQMPAVGFDLSDRSVKFVELSEQAGEVVVNSFGGRAIPDGIIEAGEIKDVAKLIYSLKSVKMELKTEYVILGLPEEKSFISRIKLPIMDRVDVREAIELQLEEHIPLSPDEAVFDFEINEDNCDRDHLDINLIAFPRTIIESYRDALLGAGFTPLVFETESHATIRSIVSVEEDHGEEINMIIDFGKTRTTFIIARGHQLQFTSTVKIGGEELEKVLVKDLGLDEFEAKKLKKEIGFVKGKKNEKVFNSLLPIVSSLKEEAQKYIAYWDSRIKSDICLKGKRISKILLCGGDANLFGLPEYLSYELNLPVLIGNPWVNIASFEKDIPKIELRESLFYSTSLGLALRALSPKK